MNRIFVIPFQVSTWHFLYAQSEFVEGNKTLPFARRIWGEPLNMPELVYQKYGSVYSSGDKTSTSTAPTSFLLAYPAYLGLWGFVLALFCVIILDLIVLGVARFIEVSLTPLVVGVVTILSMNFMISDFITVLVSHGGVVGIIMLLILNTFLSNTHSRSKRTV